MSLLAISPASDGTLWLLSSTGLHSLRTGERTARPTAPAAPLALACYGEQVFCAGSSGISYSVDQGSNWSSAWIDEIEATMTCLALSPQFASDRVALAGSAHGDLLRSNDGGRHWRLSGAGLRAEAILALAWGAGELALAATTDGLYRSQNGGRVWQPSDLAGSVQCLAATASRIYAGDEHGGIWVSSDAGHTWELAISMSTAINVILSVNADLLAATSTGEIWRYQAGTWACTQRLSAAVLCLAAQAEYVYAGCADGALFASNDGGTTWQSV